MFDAAIRPWINPALDAAGCWLSMRGLTADRVTVVGFGIKTYQRSVTTVVE
jgi:hypothetical protein